MVVRHIDQVPRYDRYLCVPLASHVIVLDIVIPCRYAELPENVVGQ